MSLPLCCRCLDLCICLCVGRSVSGSPSAVLSLRVSASRDASVGEQWRAGARTTAHKLRCGRRHNIRMPCCGGGRRGGHRGAGGRGPPSGRQGGRHTKAEGGGERKHSNGGAAPAAGPGKVLRALSHSFQAKHRQRMYVYACLQGKCIAWGLTCPKNMRSDAARSWKVTAPLKPDALLGHSRHAKQLRVHARAQVFWQWHRATSRRYPSATKAV